VYHVAATPEPDPSLAVSETVTSAPRNADGTSSVVVGAALSTLAAGDAFTAPALPATSIE
jgi:hypothetical protein